MTCTKLADIFKKENRGNKYSGNFIVALVLEHIPKCDDCFNWYMEHWVDGVFKPYDEEKEVKGKRMD